MAPRALPVEEAARAAGDRRVAEGVAAHGARPGARGEPRRRAGAPVKRLRITVWEWVFRTTMRLSNYALIRRSRACGCPACLRVAELTEALVRSRVVMQVPVGEPAPE